MGRISWREGFNRRIDEIRVRGRMRRSKPEGKKEKVLWWG
jgi:hypothetical protein